MLPFLLRCFNAVASGLVVCVFCYALPAVADYVFFMKVERSAYLGLRMDWVFSVYLVFAIAMIMRHLAIVLRAIFPAMGVVRT